MKRAALILALVCAGCAEPRGPFQFYSTAPYGSLDNAHPVTPGVYGPGVGMAATGQPVQLAPAYNGYGGDFSNSYVQQPNAYGPGIHMDQYGRPVSWQGQ